MDLGIKDAWVKLNLGDVDLCLVAQGSIAGETSMDPGYPNMTDHAVVALVRIRLG